MMVRLSVKVVKAVGIKAVVAVLKMVIPVDQLSV